MKEIEAVPGDHISEACKRLAAEAPAFLVFNGIRIEAKGGESAGDLVAYYHGEMERQSEESRRKQEAFDKTPEGQERLAQAKIARDREEAARLEMLASIERSGVRTKYAWTEAMGEISGFGGGYEDACRGMVYVGLAWLQDHPTADLSSWATADTKALEKILGIAEPGCSGAMHGATMNAVAFIHRNGWEKYVEKMTERKS